MQLFQIICVDPHPTLASHISYKNILSNKKSAQYAYLCMRSISILPPYEVSFINHDKMNHGKTVSLCFVSKNKNTNMFIKLSSSAKGMIVHDHKDERYTHYSLDLYPGDCDNIVGSFARLLCNLNVPPISSTHSLVDHVGQSPLLRAILHGKETYMQALKAPQKRLHTCCAPSYLNQIIVGMTTNADLSKMFGPC